jgi:hypothetical protein
VAADAAERTAGSVVDQEEHALEVECSYEESDEGIDDPAPFRQRTRLRCRARTLSP